MGLRRSCPQFFSRLSSVFRNNTRLEIQSSGFLTLPGLFRGTLPEWLSRLVYVFRRASGEVIWGVFLTLPGEVFQESFLSWALSLAFLGAFVDSLGALGAHRGLPETLPRRSRDVPKLRSGRSWRSRGVLRASQERFGSFLHGIASPWLAQSGGQRQPQRQPQRND